MERWQGRSASTKQLSRAISPREFQKPIISLLTATPTVRRDGLLTRKLTEACSPLLAREPLYAESPPAPLTMRTVHRFLPLVYWFGRRALDKIASRLEFGEAKSLLQRLHICSLFFARSDPNARMAFHTFTSEDRPVQYRFTYKMLESYNSALGF
ncbi:MAG: hypothetical protein IPG28_11280 [Betaproteobacteria bacterium]|nr:hypothetical protein [Betaproteobacteria bacterium]